MSPDVDGAHERAGRDLLRRGAVEFKHNGTGGANARYMKA